MKKLIILLPFVLFFSCKQRTVLSPKSSKVYECQIYSSNFDNSSLLYNAKTWTSKSFGNGEIILFEFSKPIFISKIKITQPNSTYFDKIERLKIYSNVGIIGEFRIDSIFINKKVFFLVLNVTKTKSFIFTKAYSQSSEFQIALEKINKPIAINNIEFFDGDSAKIQLFALRNAYFRNSDYKKFPKSLNIKPFDRTLIFTDFGFLAMCKNKISDTLYIGKIINSRTNEFSVKELIFSNKQYFTKKMETKLTQNDTSFSLSGIGNFIFDFPDYAFVDLNTFGLSLITDIRYATTNNFTHKQIYPCAKCLFRYKAAKDLFAAIKEFDSLGYRIKIFDAYRPLSAQYKLWQAMPNINYVAPPDKGSIHNRGAALDMTLTDMKGNELNMGTPFDFFGVQAFSTNLCFPDSILQNRQLMWNVMNKHGFRQIKTEWWHLSHNSCMQFPITDLPFPCD